MKSSSDPIDQSKARLREKLKQLRSQVTPGMAEAASQRVWTILAGLPEFKKAKGIGAFASTPNEINTFSILESSLESGKNLFLPRVAKDKAHFDYYLVRNLENLEPGRFGIPEPAEGRPADWGELDLVLVPGLAFDKTGNRLGYGQGYYDRILPHLKKTCLTIGLAYSFQVDDQVPVSLKDVPVQALLTEMGFTYCK